MTNPRHSLRRCSGAFEARPLFAVFALAMAATSSALAGVPLAPLSGVSITSYTVNGSTPGRAGATSTSLTFSNTDNGGFTPTFVVGSLSGDSISGGNWDLNAVGADYGIYFPEPILNLIGASMQGTPDLAVGDGISHTFVLVFTQAQTFSGLNLLGGTNTNVLTATLALSGGGTTDLMTTSVGTVFAAGTYTFGMTGSGTGGDVMALYAGFAPAAVPGGGIAVLVGLLGGLRGRRRR